MNFVFSMLTYRIINMTKIFWRVKIKDIFSHVQMLADYGIRLIDDITFDEIDKQKDIYENIVLVFFNIIIYFVTN